MRIRGSAAAVLVAWAVPALAGAQAGAPPAGPAPLTLREAIAEALQRSPDLQPAHDAVTAAEIGRRQAASQFNLKVTPSFSTGSTAGLDRRQVAVTVTQELRTGTRVTVEADSTSAGSIRETGYAVSFSQPLLRGFGATATHGLTLSKRAMESSERSLADASQQMVVTVAEAYFAVLRQERLAQATAHSRDRALKLREASEKRAAVGLATKLDVLRAELLASQAEAALAVQVEALEASRDRLKVLLGRPLDDPLPVAAEAPDAGPVASLPGFEAPDGPIDELVAQALAARLDARESRDRIEDARRDTRIARWDLLPPVNLQVGYAGRGPGLLAGAVATPAAGGWHVGLTLTHALDRTTQEAALARASLGERAARRAANDTAQRIAADVRRAHRAWTRSAGTLGIHRQAVDVAERQLRLAELRYERGLADNFDVVDAENNLFSAQSALIGAEVERALAGLHLRRAMGTIDPAEYLR
jgi:outer membrane protein TolC